MGWFDGWRKKHDVSGDTPLSELSSEARLDLLQGAELESAEAGDVDSMFELGRLLARRGDFEGARTWLTKAAEAGHPAAVEELMATHLPQAGAGQSDQPQPGLAESVGMDEAHARGLQAEADGLTDEALKWHLEAAEAGHPAAAFRLGFLYGKRGDDRESIRWYSVSAAAGDRDSMYNLGNKYMNVGDKPEALRWYARAADAGDTDAMAMLGGDCMQHSSAP